jgi:hypothetical protein
LEKLAEKEPTSDAGDVADMRTTFERSVALLAVLERSRSFDAIHGKTRRSTGQE